MRLRPQGRAGSADPIAPPPKLVYTPQELADLLGVSITLLRTWRAQGLGPAAMQLGERTLRYHVADVEAFIAGSRAGGLPPEGQA
jgi:DNA-binding transcriptional MerR regulator